MVRPIRKLLTAGIRCGRMALYFCIRFASYRIGRRILTQYEFSCQGRSRN